MCFTACFVVKGTFLQPMEKSAGGTLVDCILAKQVDKFINFFFQSKYPEKVNPLLYPCCPFSTLSVFVSREPDISGNIY